MNFSKQLSISTALKYFNILILCLLLNIAGFAQKKINIKGQLKEESGEPILATINIKGTTITVTSSPEGLFIIKNVLPDAVLLISGVNIEPLEIKLNGKNDIGIISVKTKIKEGENVIVEASTGYQRIRPNEINGSVAVVDNSAFNRQTGTSILKRLEGTVSGLLFDNNKLVKGQIKNDNITIRGLSTINGSTAVLTVLDGFIYEGDINNINPNDVENITLLKDAAATSIWGARASNGVIVITTKKGKFNQALQVSLNINTIINQKPDLYYLPQMKSSDYINVEQFLFNQGFFDSRINRGYIALTPAVEIFLSKRNGLITANDSATQIEALKAIDTRDQYNKYVYQNAVTQQYSVNLRGGSNINAYTFSANYDKIAGETRNESRKINLKVENDFRPFANFQVNTSVYYTNGKSLSGLPAYNSLLVNNRQIPYLKLADDNNNPLPVSLNLRNSYTDTAGIGKLLNWKFYPLENYKHDATTINTQEIYSILNLQYRFLKYFDFNISYQYQKQTTETLHLSDAESFSARNSINLYSQLNRETGAVTYIVPLGGKLNTDHSTVESQTTRSQLNFLKAGGLHSISAILGAEMRQSKSYTDNNTVFGYNSDPLTYSVVDFVNPYPLFTNGNYSYIPGAPYFLNSVNRFISAYANASYSYKNRYSFSASGREDGSNIFGLSSNDKWRPLWSIGASWKILNEPFIKSSLFSFLRLRTTYGFSGNVDLSRSAEAVAGYLGGAPVTSFSYARIFTLNNPGLRWEKTGMYNIGIDFSTKGEVLSGSVDYYHKKSTDLYGPTPYDYTTWGLVPVITKNVAAMEGKGIDLTVNIKTINRKLQWNTIFIFNYNTDKTTRYEDDAAKSINSKLGDGSGIVAEIGKPLYAISAYKWGGLDREGNPQGYVNGEKSIDYNAIFNEGYTKGVDGNIRYIGRSTAPAFGSIINTFAWKNFTLSASILYKFGYYFQKTSIVYSSLVSNGIGHSDYAKRWQKPGDELITNVPSFVYPNDENRDNFYQLTEATILKAGHARLQYVNLAYGLSRSKNKKLLFSSMQFYINAANLGLIWKANKEGLDPEYPAALRPERTITFGVRFDL
ncbi:MAG: SusC/RagA family TonB-linked outer membrane protein [Chitinophagaceae bacterium]